MFLQKQSGTSSIVVEIKFANSDGGLDNMNNFGKIQVFTGDGRGKTSAAMGTCLRTIAAGGKVLFLQFLKTGGGAEFKAAAAWGGQFTHRAFGREGFVRGEPDAADMEKAGMGLTTAAAALKSGEYDLIVLDEVNCAVAAGLFSADALLAALAARAAGVEVILTGRGATEKITAAADLVTEMINSKHYYDNGVNARKGIDL